MKRTLKYTSRVAKWDDVEIGDVLILEGNDGNIFDIIIMKKSHNETRKCDDCPLSKDNRPGECMHYSFACSEEMIATSINKIMENL